MTLSSLAHSVPQASTMVLFVVVASLALSACGGGGGSSSASSPAPVNQPNTGSQSSTAETTPPETVTTSSSSAGSSGSTGGSSDAADSPDTTPEQDNPATAAGGGAGGSSKDNPNPAIDVLALVTPDAVQRYPEDPELRVLHMLAVANLALADSGLGARFRLVGTRLLGNDVAGDSEAALLAITDPTAGELAQLPAWQDEANADLVVIFRAYANDGACGLAWIGGTATGWQDAEAARYGKSTVAIDCSDLTLAHELGHNMGLAHSRRVDPDGGHVPWAAGFGVDQEFTTIMASPSTYDAPQLARFSDPDQLCLGHPCGVPTSDSANGADAVNALAMSSAAVAAFSELR